MTELVEVDAYRESQFEYDIYMEWGAPTVDSDGVCEADISIAVGNPLDVDLMYYVQYTDGAIATDFLPLDGGMTSTTLRLDGHSKTVDWVTLSQMVRARFGQALGSDARVYVKGIVWEQLGLSLNCQGGTGEGPSDGDTVTRFDPGEVDPLNKVVRKQFGLPFQEEESTEESTGVGEGSSTGAGAGDSEGSDSQ